MFVVATQMETGSAPGKLCRLQLLAWHVLVIKGLLANDARLEVSLNLMDNRNLHVELHTDSSLHTTPFTNTTCGPPASDSIGDEPSCSIYFVTT